MAADTVRHYLSNLQTRYRINEIQLSDTGVGTYYQIVPYNPNRVFLYLTDDGASWGNWWYKLPSGLNVKLYGDIANNYKVEWSRDAHLVYQEIGVIVGNPFVIQGWEVVLA